MPGKTLAEIAADRWRIEAEVRADLDRRSDWIVEIPPRYVPFRRGAGEREKGEEHGSAAEPGSATVGIARRA